MASTRQILLLMDTRFVDEIDAAYPRFGFSDRATFIRDAVLKELAKKGVPLPTSYRAAPPRVGESKGGRPRIMKMPEAVPCAKVAEGELAKARPLTKVRYPKGKK